MDSLSRRLILHLAVVAALVCSAPIAIGADEQLVNPYAGREDIVDEGASLLNQYCSHCHGPYAVQGERPRDLRRLNLRYGEDMISTFYSTVQEGRMQKGMPYWKGILKDDVVWKIYTFLQTIQIED